MFHRFLLVEFMLGERPKRTPPLRMEKMGLGPGGLCRSRCCLGPRRLSEKLASADPEAIGNRGFNPGASGL